MDLILLLVLAWTVFISICLAIIFLADSDILTFLALHFGKSPEQEYSGKVIWITGASSGIGEALAKELIRCNAKLVLSARREAELERVKKECLAINSKSKDSDILLMPFDMNDISKHETCFKGVLKRFGKLDVLISNAGRSQRANWHKISLSVDKELFDLNLFSLINLNRIVVHHFLETGSGHIVVNSSMAGKIAAPFSASYTGSKHAIQGYFNSLRNEMSQNNIKVTILCPGATVSSFLGEAFTENPGEKFGKSHRSGDRRMTAERCAVISVAAMANQLEEAWMALFPYVAMVYFNQYLPYFGSKLQSWMARSGTFIKLRDGRDTMKEK